MTDSRLTRKERNVTTDENVNDDVLEDIGHWLTVLHQLDKGLSIDKLKTKKGLEKCRCLKNFIDLHTIG